MLTPKMAENLIKMAENLIPPVDTKSSQKFENFQSLSLNTFFLFMSYVVSM